MLAIERMGETVAGFFFAGAIGDLASVFM